MSTVVYKFNIRSIRIQKDVSYEELAAALGVTRATIYNYEEIPVGDHRNIPLERFLKISLILSCDPSHLIACPQLKELWESVMGELKIVRINDNNVIGHTKLYYDKANGQDLLTVKY